MAVVVFRSKASGEVIMMRQHVEPIFKEAGKQKSRRTKTKPKKNLQCLQQFLLKRAFTR